MSGVVASLPASSVAEPHALIVPPMTPMSDGSYSGSSSKLFFHPFVPLLHLMSLPQLYVPHRPFHHHHRPPPYYSPFGGFPYRGSPSAPVDKDHTKASASDSATYSTLPSGNALPPFTSLITPTGQVVPIPEHLRPLLNPDGTVPYPLSKYLSTLGGANGAAEDEAKADQQPLGPFDPLDLNVIASPQETPVVALPSLAEPASFADLVSKPLCECPEPQAAAASSAETPAEEPETVKTPAPPVTVAAQPHGVPQSSLTPAITVTSTPAPAYVRPLAYPPTAEPAADSLPAESPESLKSPAPDGEPPGELLEDDVALESTASPTERSDSASAEEGYSQTKSDAEQTPTLQPSAPDAR